VKVVLFANTEWYLYNFRRSLAAALRDAGHEVLLVSPPGPYGEKLRELGYRWLPAPMERRSLNPLRELALVWWLRQLFGASAWTWCTGSRSRVRCTGRWRRGWVVCLRG
jgi:hypothetical protein